MKTAGVRPHVVKLLCKTINKECRILTSRKSLLRYTSAKTLKKFEWKMMESEMKTAAPILLAILKSALTRRSSPPDIHKVCMAAAVLLKGRNKNISVIQSIISVLLYSGHCSKMVYYI